MTDGSDKMRVGCDATNPGHFFACCGLLELAARLWSGAEGWFESGEFRLRSVGTPSGHSISALLNELAKAPLANTMTSAQLSRREELGAMPKKLREADDTLESEKKRLDALYRESPVCIGSPFSLTVDWFVDEYSGGDELKTWAGQQAVIDIAYDMKRLIKVSGYPEDCLSDRSPASAVPFNFDSDLAGIGSDLDLGFSLDPLKDTGLKILTRPLVEFAAFIGLERFRPYSAHRGKYQFSLWHEPLPPELAAAVCSGVIDCLGAQKYEFSLLYRTKYLKSFLPANTI